MFQKDTELNSICNIQPYRNAPYLTLKSTFVCTISANALKYHAFVSLFFKPSKYPCPHNYGDEFFPTLPTSILRSLPIFTTTSPKKNPQISVSRGPLHDHPLAVGTRNQCLSPAARTRPRPYSGHPTVG